MIECLKKYAVYADIRYIKTEAKGEFGMKYKKIISFAFVLLTIIVMGSLTAAAATGNPLRIDANTGGNNYYIDLGSERLMPDSPEAPVKILYMNVNGGSKWTQIIMNKEGVDISKILNKDAVIKISDALYDKKIKALPAGAAVWTFPPITKRAASPKYTINYFDSKNNDGDYLWMLDGIDLTSTEIAEAKGKVPGIWENFFNEKTDQNGRTVPKLKDGKQQKEIYYIRTAAVNEANFIRAASKPRKLTVAGLAKPTNFKVDYKTEAIKTKAGVEWKIEDESGLTVKGDITLGLLSGEKDNYGKTYYFRSVPAADKNGLKRRPPSEWQLLKVENQDLMNAADALNNVSITSAGKVSVKSAVIEVWNTSSGKWGSSVPSDADGIKVRFKPNIKYDKNNKPSGTTASKPVELAIEKNDSGKAEEIKPANPEDLGNAVLFFQKKTTDDRIIYDKNIKPGAALVEFDIKAGAGITVKSEDYKIVFSGAGATMFTRKSNPVSAKLVIEGTVAAVRIDELPKNEAAFTAGALNIKIERIPESSEDKFSVFSETASRTLTASPVLKAVTSGDLKEKSSEIKIKAEKSESVSYSTDLTFELGEDPFWDFSDLKFVMMNSTAAPNPGSGKYGDELEIAGTSPAMVNVENVGTNYTVFARVTDENLPFSNSAAKNWVKLYTVQASDYNAAGTASIISGGVIGGKINKAVAPADITVKLNGNNLKSASAGDDVTGWINLPKGLSAKLENITESVADTQITIQIEGIPTSASSANISVTIPASSLAYGNTAIKTADNPSVKFDITSPGATVEPVVISGVLGKEINASVTVKLNSAVDFQSSVSESDLKNWIKNLPSGLEAESAQISGSAATIVIKGIPAAVLSANLNIVIPAAATDNGSITVVTGTDTSSAKFDIKDQSAAVSNWTVWGTVGQPLISDQKITITLVNDEFQYLQIGSDVSVWFENRPGNITAKIKSYGPSGVIVIEFGGTPVRAVDEDMKIVIPYANLKNRGNLQTDLVVDKNAATEFYITPAS